jgi:CBS domain-containing protein
MRSKEIMTRNILTVKQDMDVHKLAEFFIEKNISGAPVTDENGKFLGVVLEDAIIFKDTKIHLPTFVYFLSGFFTVGEKKFEDELKKISATTVSGIMESKPVTISPETPVEDVATMMIDKGIHYFPVLENSKLVGIVTKKDIVRAIAKQAL